MDSGLAKMRSVCMPIAFICASLYVANWACCRIEDWLLDSQDRQLWEAELGVMVLFVGCCIALRSRRTRRGSKRDGKGEGKVLAPKEQARIGKKRKCKLQDALVQMVGNAYQQSSGKGDHLHCLAEQQFEELAALRGSGEAPLAPHAAQAIL